MHKHLEQGSKRHAPRSGATFCVRPSPLFSLSRLCPSSNTTACLRSCFPLSQLTGWHTFQRAKSLNEKTEEKTRACTWAHKWTHVIICKHRHAHWGLQTHLTRRPIHRWIHARRGKPAAHTHTSTHFQSPPASCLPTLHLINPCVSLTKQERALSSLWTLEQVA